MIEQMKKRMEIGDVDAIFNLGCCYNNGMFGLPQDHAKALHSGIRQESLVIQNHITVLAMLTMLAEL